MSKHRRSRREFVHVAGLGMVGVVTAPLAGGSLRHAYAGQAQTHYNPDKFVFYGEDLMKRCMAYRSMLDAGVYACAGSDFSPGPFAPLMGIQGMVTRRGWDGKTWGANQRVSVSEAIAINSYNGAWASKEEAIKGSVTTGKLADYLILAEDRHAVDVEKIKDIQIVRTVVGGRVSHQA